MSLISGIDASKEMLDVARDMNPAPNITYSVGDARTVGDNPEWRGRFDKVTCFYVIHWFPEHDKAFRSILECLKPGGEALFLMDNRTTALNDIELFLTTHSKWSQYLKV